MSKIDVVFDGPPSHESGRFVEVESPPGFGISFGEWVRRDDGYWVLRFTDPAPLFAALMAIADGAPETEPVDPEGTADDSRDYGAAHMHWFLASKARAVLPDPA